VSVFIQIFLVSSVFRKTILFRRRGVSAVQGHPRSPILVPIESAYATSY